MVTVVTKVTMVTMVVSGYIGPLQWPHQGTENFTNTNLLLSCGYYGYQGYHGNHGYQGYHGC